MKQEQQKEQEIKHSEAKEKFSFTQHPVIGAAIITTFGVVITAVVTGGFGLVTKYMETRSTSSNTNQNVSSITLSNDNILRPSPNSNTENQNGAFPEKVVAKPIPLGTRQTLTLLPATIGSIEWKISCCNNEIIFVSPDDKNKWVKFKTSGEEHFVSLRVTLTDSNNGIDYKTLSTGQLKELDNILLETKSFKAIITPTEILTGDDTDSEKQYPLVFKKIVLSMKVEESNDSNEKTKTK